MDGTVGQDKPILFAGVDLGGNRIRAGVFNTSCQLLGKAKFSAKIERGPQAVLDRTARCVRDAIDEADLTLAQISALGVAVPGRVTHGDRLTCTSPYLGWENIAAQEELQQRLQLPVVVENDCNLAAFASYLRELPKLPQKLALIYLERSSGVGQVIDGQIPPELCQPGPNLVELQGLTKDPVKRNPAKQLRKAILAGKAEAEKVVRRLAEAAGDFAVQTINRLRPDMLVLGGGAIEELKEWLLPGTLDGVQDRVAPDAVMRVEILVSQLDNDAPILGAALLAMRAFSPSSTPTAG